MPIADGGTYGFKYVNGHPRNVVDGLRDGYRLRPSCGGRDRLPGPADRNDHPDRAQDGGDLGHGDAATWYRRAHAPWR